ncbi:NUDIX hydrolase [Vibrio vulnificus]|nr:NUDIX hydrolase [Vibrio vulnificus]
MIVTIDATCFRIQALNGKHIPQVLLKKRDKPKEPAFNEYALVGGWVWESPIKGSAVFDNDIEQAFERIINTKLGADLRYAEQIPSVGSMGRDSRGWSLTVLHYALLTEKSAQEIDGKDGYMWVSVEDVLDGSFKLPFDHRYLVAKCWVSFTRKAAYSSVGLYSLPEEFTVYGAVKVFESLGVALTKQTVQNRWKKDKLIISTGNKVKEGSGPLKGTFVLNEKELTYFPISLSVEDTLGANAVIREHEKAIRAQR